MRPLDFLDRDGELGRLAGQLLAVIVRRERQRESLGLARLHATGSVFEFLQHLAFAEHERKIIGLAAGELDAFNLAEEVQRDAVTGLRRTIRAAVAMLASLTLGVVMNALLAQDVDGLVDLGVGDIGLGLLNLGRRQVPDLHLRVDLEGRFEYQCAVDLLVGLRLDTRETGDAQVVSGGRLTEGAAHLVVEDFALDDCAVLCGDHLHRHLARTEAWRLGGARADLQALLHLFADLRQRHSQSNSALKFFQCFDCSCHVNRPVMLVESVGARRGTRTPTPLLASGPKPGASTNFAILAATTP